MKIQHIAFQLWPGSGEYSVELSTPISRRGKMPGYLAPLTWSIVTRVPAGWNPSVFSECEADMYAAARRYCMNKLPQARDVAWEALSPRILTAALEFGSPVASELLLREFLDLKIPSGVKLRSRKRRPLVHYDDDEGFQRGYNDDRLMDEIFGWHARWIELTIAARISRTHIPDFFRFARNQWRSLRRSLETTGRRPTKGWGSGQLAEPAEPEPGLLEGYIDHRPLDGMPFWKIATLERRGELYHLPQPKVFGVGIEGINHTRLWLPKLPVPVIEAPAYDPTIGRAMIAYDDSPKESQWLLVSQGDLSPGRRRKAMMREAPAAVYQRPGIVKATDYWITRPPALVTIASASAQDERRASRGLSRKRREELIQHLYKNVWIGCGMEHDFRERYSLSMSIPYRNETWYRALKPIERRFINRFLYSFFNRPE